MKNEVIYLKIPMTRKERDRFKSVCALEGRSMVEVIRAVVLAKIEARKEGEG